MSGDVNTTTLYLKVGDAVEPYCRGSWTDTHDGRGKSASASATECGGRRRLGVWAAGDYREDIVIGYNSYQADAAHGRGNRDLETKALQNGNGVPMTPDMLAPAKILPDRDSSLFAVLERLFAAGSGITSYRSCEERFEVVEDNDPVALVVVGDDVRIQRFRSPDRCHACFAKDNEDRDLANANYLFLQVSINVISLRKHWSLDNIDKDRRSYRNSNNPKAIQTPSRSINNAQLEGREGGLVKVFDDIKVARVWSVVTGMMQAYHSLNYSLD
ncbi:hypothetical protein BDR07DRAFT_1382792 [Suillus spraguei]|nr:hypothetical protein BDR07DRAFT_1382792 [Suillus spraguei]